MAATFFTGVGVPDAFDTAAGMPGAAPVPGGQMTGNPDPHQDTMPQVNIEPPIPQNSSAQSISTQLANGTVPHNLQPTNVAQGVGAPAAGAPAGGDSLLAMMSRGQIMRGDSTYGQPVSVSRDNGPQVQPSAVVPPVATGPASGVTYAGTGNYSGM